MRPETTGRACQAAGKSGRAGGYVHPSGGYHRPGVPENGQLPRGAVFAADNGVVGRRRVLRAPVRDLAAGHQYDPAQDRMKPLAAAFGDDVAVVTWALPPTCRAWAF